MLTLIKAYFLSKVHTFIYARRIYYKATQLTLTETVLLSFLSPTLKKVLSTFRSNHLSGFMEKQLYHKTFGNFQVKKWHILSQQNSCQQYSVCRKNLKLSKERLHQKSYSSSQIHKSMSRYHNKNKNIGCFIANFEIVFVC